MYVCMYVYTYVCMYVCMYMCVYVYVYMCMYVYAHTPSHIVGVVCASCPRVVDVLHAFTHII